MWSFLEPLIGPLVNRVLDFIPNPEEKAKATIALQQQLQTAVLAAEQSQLEIDKIEAASPSMFVAGWRPFIGWLCGFALGWQYVILPLLSYVVNIYCTSSGTKIPPLPVLDSSTLYPLLMAMLGLGGMHTYERQQGVAVETLTTKEK